MTDSTPLRSYLFVGAFYVFLALLLTPFVLHEIYANDLWKSLYFGRYVAQFGVFPHHSTFTFSPVVHPVPSDVYSWLGHVVLYGVYLIGTIDGLIWLRIVIFAGSLLLFHSLFEFKRSGPVFLLLLLWGIALTQKTLVRTALFAIPLTMVFWWLWYNEIRGRTKTHVLWLSLPVLFVIWGNLHASYLVGIGVLLLMALGSFLDELRGVGSPVRVSSAGMGGLVILCVAIVVFVKPYPDTKLLRLSTSAMNLATETVSDVMVARGTDQPSLREQMYHGTDSTESMMRIGGRSFTPDYLYSPYVAVSFVLFLGCGFLLFLYLKPFRWFFVLPVLAAMLCAGMFLRFVAYIPLIVLPATYLSYLCSDQTISFDREVLISTVCWAIGVLFLVPWFYVATGSMNEVMHNPDFRTGWGTAPKFSGKMAKFVKNELGNTNVFNHYDIGGFLIWSWWPEKKVFIDSKDKAYRSEFRDAYFRESPMDLMEKHGLDWALFPLGSAWNYYVFIPDPDWQLIKYDKGMALYVRASVAQKKDLEMKTKTRPLGESSSSRRIKRFQRFLRNHENQSGHVGVFRSLPEK